MRREGPQASSDRARQAPANRDPAARDAAEPEKKNDGRGCQNGWSRESRWSGSGVAMRLFLERPKDTKAKYRTGRI